MSTPERYPLGGLQFCVVGNAGTPVFAEKLTEAMNALSEAQAFFTLCKPPHPEPSPMTEEWDIWECFCRHFHGVAVCGAFPETAAGPLRSSNEGGIPTITCDFPVEDGAALSHLGPDHVQAGARAAEALEYACEAGELLVRWPVAPTAAEEARIRGFESGAEANGRTVLCWKGETDCPDGAGLYLPHEGDAHDLMPRRNRLSLKVAAWGTGLDACGETGPFCYVQGPDVEQTAKAIVETFLAILRGDFPPSSQHIPFKEQVYGP